MTNQLSAMLGTWQENRDSTEWVLGTVYRTEGSAYRKAGAMMLINGHGQQFGLLSGGCLEADIIRNARRAMVTGKPVMLTYDGTDEDDLSFKLGVGCGGTVYIMLQPLGSANDLGLGDLYEALQKRQSGLYFQKIDAVEGYFEAGALYGQRPAHIENREDGNWLVTPIQPEPHVLVVGGGLDARPVIGIAHQMGWQTTLVDPRPANARAEHFQAAGKILRKIDGDLATYVTDHKVDAVILMAHSVSIDAAALAVLCDAPIKHLSALGPRHRFRDVLNEAGISRNDLAFDISSPAGLDIGGQLPESIALSMLSGIHAALFKQSAAPALAQAAE
ncbi:MULTISPECIES: XdhC/CoxI family protein [unclassified Thalassospira]|uniref:XdhC family protein n=1 Tax=unclassified Thalassospira TaxID=2648997 RepID=UPI0007A59FAA|nr:MULTISPECIES: XdhC/CoxI family protein [unclassified Thalassospira]KZC98360.1 xanthine dehydrogenase [Thalassospira sp. MCCC 1A02898]ONH86786.1 xanthine dehydrogenase [Thalassospira sp. MCCC 1A02803]